MSNLALKDLENGLANMVERANLRMLRMGSVVYASTPESYEGLMKLSKKMRDIGLNPARVVALWKLTEEELEKI